MPPPNAPCCCETNFYSVHTAIHAQTFELREQHGTAQPTRELQSAHAARCNAMGLLSMGATWHCTRRESISTRRPSRGDDAADHNRWVKVASERAHLKAQLRCGMWMRRECSAVQLTAVAQWRQSKQLGPGRKRRKEATASLSVSGRRSFAHAHRIASHPSPPLCLAIR